MPYTETRPGKHTTEFLLTAGAFALGVLQEAIGVFNIHDATVLKAQAFLIGLYTLSRGLAKQGVPAAQFPPVTEQPPADEGDAGKP